jgi:hypothetical protein
MKAILPVKINYLKIRDTKNIWNDKGPIGMEKNRELHAVWFKMECVRKPFNYLVRLFI